MSLLLSIARKEPLCIKASADVAAAWGRNEKGYGFSDLGAIDYPGGQSLEITLNFAVRPNANAAEFAKFPLDLETSGDINDDHAPVGVYAVKQGKATIAIMVPALQGELEMSLDENVELDRVVLAMGTGAHIRMIVSVKLCSAAEAAESDTPEETPLLVQAEIGVTVHGTSRAASSTEGGVCASQPFVEQTSTAIVFAHGAVVRLAEIVAPGQILILRHGASNEETACRVVSVKTNTSARAFVELEFLQHAPGFWGASLPEPSGGGRYAAATARHSAGESKKLSVSPTPVSAVPAALTGVPPAEPARISPAVAARHVFAKLLEVPAAIGEALLGGSEKTDESDPRAVAAAEMTRESFPVAVPSTEVAEESTRAIAELEIVAPAETQIANEVSEKSEPAEIAVPAVSAATEPIVAKPPIPEIAIVTTAAAQPVLATSTELTPVRNATLPPAVVAKPATVAATEPVAPKVEATRSRDIEPTIPRARPATPALTGGAILTADKSFAWTKHDNPKRSRFGSIAVASAAIIALAAGAGFYRWQEGTKSSANVAAATDPAPAASASAAGSNPVSAPGSNAPPSAVATAGGVAPAAARKSPNAGSAQPGGSAGPATAKFVSATPSETTPNFARGPEVAEAKMPAPTSTTRSASQATPSIMADAPGAADGAAGNGIFSESESGGPAAPPPARISSGAQQPRLLSAPAPIYPNAARAQHIEGDVSVDLLISDTGKITSLAVLSGPAKLRDAAVAALSQRKYAPAMLDGKAIPSHIVVTIHFQL